MSDNTGSSEGPAGPEISPPLTRGDNTFNVLPRTEAPEQAPEGPPEGESAPEVPALVPAVSARCLTAPIAHQWPDDPADYTPAHQWLLLTDAWSELRVGIRSIAADREGNWDTPEVDEQVGELLLEVAARAHGLVLEYFDIGASTNQAG